MKREKTDQAAMKVDFGYAFSTPHRLTVAWPDSSDKTLLDVQPEFLRLAWSDDDLRAKPLAAFTAPQTHWDLHLTAELDGKPLSLTGWKRSEGWLPILQALFGTEKVGIRIEVSGGRSATLVRLEIANRDRKAHRFCLRCEKPGNWIGVNPAWVQPEWDADVLLAGWQDRADRVLILGLGGDEKPLTGSTHLDLAWNLKPGTRDMAWLVRPYRAFQSMLPALRKKDWSAEFDASKIVWRRKLGRASRISVPDEGVQNGFLACLADCFVMREPVADGTVVATPGTEIYRAPNPFEPLIVSVLFDQLGLHRDAVDNAAMFIRQQGPDGNWADPKGWAHYMWGASGIKCWAIMEHFRLTGDREFLAAAFSRMLASSLWQETQRKRTRVRVKGKRTLSHGLMPRGMGDGGLLGEDGSHYGVFLTHNILAVYADRMTIEAARILGKSRHLPKLERNLQIAHKDLLRALEDGSIKEEGYRWIPGVPGHTCGSRWGALYAAFPCGILAPDHELIHGTIRKFEERMSPGGIPVHTGWMKDGMWVAATLDNLAEVHLRRGEGDAAMRYLYATLNHGTPLYTWCEERGQEPGATECSGDRQHLWTPVAVCRLLRDAMVFEDGNTLHLARGTARQWLGGDKPVAVTNLPTHFGRISYEMRFSRDSGRIAGFIKARDRLVPRLVLHLRLPGERKINPASLPAGATLGADQASVEWQGAKGLIRFDLEME